MKVQGIDIDNKSDLDKEAIFNVFQSLLRSFSSHIQILFKSSPIDLSAQKQAIQSNIISANNNMVKEYGMSYLEYIEERSVGKLDKVNYLIIKTERRCSYEEGKAFLEGVYRTISTSLSHLNLKTTKVEGEELEEVYYIPDFIKEEIDYFVYGEEYKRTYVVTDYPREAYPNWLKPIFNFEYPIETSQHLHPIPRNKVIKQLELQVAKLQSTMDVQEENGDVVSSELKVRYEDTLNLLKRLASGEDNIMDTSFYITISERNKEMLDYHSIQLESYMRQCGLNYRRCRKDVKQGILSYLPICEDHLLSTYTLDTKSLSTLLPFTAQDFLGKEGIIYGLSADMSQLIMLDSWSMPNPNKLILGKSGFGKSMLAKTETGRHIINGIQSIVIDHNDEWRDFCNIMGGDYIENDDAPIRWDCHLLVFGSDNKVNSLQKIWKHIQSEDVKQRVLVIEEFHNILRDDKKLLLQVVKEIRKSGTAPTFITQNVRDYLASEEGQMIFDNCSIKVLLRQGENDLYKLAQLFDLSRSEKVFLNSCPQGYGYLYTDLYKMRFKSDYSEREEEILSTNPMHIIRRTK